jgi:hypothetical protein
LTFDIIEADPGAIASVRNLIAVACTMAAYLNKDQRAIVSAFLRNEANVLSGPLH